MEVGMRNAEDAECGRWNAECGMSKNGIWISERGMRIIKRKNIAA